MSADKNNKRRPKPERENWDSSCKAMPPVCRAMIVPMPPMKLMTPFACERNCGGRDIGHERDDRRAPKGRAQQQGAGAGHKQGKHSGERDQPKRNGGDRCTDQDEGDAASKGRAQSIRPGADRTAE